MDKRQNINNFNIFKGLGLGFIFIITASALLALLSHVEYIRNLFEDLFYLWISYNFGDALHYMNGFKALITGNFHEVIAQSPVLHALPGMGIAYLINLISRDAFVTYGILLIVYNLASVFVWYKVVRSLLIVKSKPIAIFLSILLVAFLHINGFYTLYVFEKKPAIIIVGLSILWLIKHFPSPHKTFRSYTPYFLSTILIGLFHTYTMLIWFGVMIGLSIYNLICSYNQKNFKKSLGIVLASGLAVLLWAIVWQIIESYIGGETLHEARERISIIKGLLFTDVGRNIIIKAILIALLIAILILIKILINRRIYKSPNCKLRLEYAFILGYTISTLFVFHSTLTMTTLQNFHFVDFSNSFLILMLLVALIN
ncbi:MAG: hypothetical protein GXO48_01465, partial [Chlorobi bacterium]|nr:hypothetical protein [Chlorobiota bacterium]